MTTQNTQNTEDTNRMQLGALGAKVGNYIVSTVKLDYSNPSLRFLDMMLGQNRMNKPYETMVFDATSDDMISHDTKHYDTEAEARAGHALMISKWEQKLGVKMHETFEKFIDYAS